MLSEIEKLYTLAKDLAGSTSVFAEDLWGYVDNSLWEETRNPWLILQKLSKKKLESLNSDPKFKELVNKHYSKREQKIKNPGFFQKNYPNSPLKSSAFFSMEFGLSEALPIYSGGLGMLAGDFLKAANDLNLPLIGVGLLYQQGYFRQLLDENGEQKEFFPFNDPNQLPISQVKDENNNPLFIPLEMPGRTVQLRVYKAHIETITLYLLDSNDLINSPIDRGITNELYNAETHSRLMQEIVLGIGGYRLLHTLKIPVDICHLNEGHAAFAILERARFSMLEKNISFNEALEHTKKTNLFTTHTAIKASFDLFDPKLLEHYLSDYINLLGIPFSEFLNLGRVEETELFNMAFLALRGSHYVNAVSRLHKKVSQKLFMPLFPGTDEEKVPISYVTNGVHIPSWIGSNALTFWKNKCENSFYNSSNLLEKLQNISDSDLWEFRRSNRKKLIEYARERLQKQIDSSGYHTRQPIDIQNLFNPDVLTIGFARRFAPYKRTNLLLKDPERLLKICMNKAMPVQIIIAGKAHPNDEEGKKMVGEWTNFIRHSEMRSQAIFLSDYDILLAERMVQGMDLWINMPKRPWEACGTSGMKLIANGGLNLSELDGWWDEAYTTSLGWALPNKEEKSDDTKEANNLYDLLENRVIPTFYENKEGASLGWTNKMRNSMSNLTYQFSANRMVKEYLEKHYLPALEK